MFFCVLLYIFMLLPSLKFPRNFLLCHLGSDLQAFEVGRFFPALVSLVLGSLSLVLGTTLDAVVFSVHLVKCILIWSG